MSLHKKLCVVAGSGPGMGYAIARRFAREGYDIALFARSATALEAGAQSVRELGVRAIGIAVDLSDADDVRRAFVDIRRTLGDPNVLVYNAARWHEVPAMTIDPSVFTADLQLNITGALVCAQQVVPAMNKARAGSLLFTGGGLALFPEAGASLPSLTVGKAGLRALAHVLHGALTPDGIKVGTVTIAGTVMPGSSFDPDLIADAYWALHSQEGGPVEIVFDGESPL